MLWGRIFSLLQLKNQPPRATIHTTQLKGSKNYIASSGRNSKDVTRGTTTPRAPRRSRSRQCRKKLQNRPRSILLPLRKCLQSNKLSRNQEHHGNTKGRTRIQCLSKNISKPPTPNTKRRNTNSRHLPLSRPKTNKAMLVWTTKPRTTKVRKAQSTKSRHTK